MKIFVTGARGQLGSDLVPLLAARGHAVAGADLPEFDAADPAQVRARLDGVAPELLVNCAAYTRVDDCEREESLARRVNAAAPRLLAAWARERGARLVHVSTDYVFAGDREPPRPYLETDEPGPVSAYGRTKLEGERALAESGARWAILRTAWLYGRTGANFPKAILRKALAAPGEPLRVVDDQFGSPTWSLRLAEQIARVAEAGAEGLYHATAEGWASWYEFACHWLTSLGVPHAVQPCRAADYPRPARRPANSILENARLKAQGLNAMRDWRTDVEEFARRHGAELVAECRR